MKTKQCVTCKEIKPLSEFTKDIRGKQGVNMKCKECNNAYQNRKKKVQDRREYQAQTLYGLSPQDHRELLESQDGRCAICGLYPIAKTLQIDHCHNTGKVRGLLCQKCNTGLAMFRDESELCRLAAEYLDNH